MATYAQRYALIANEEFWQRVYVALLVASNDIVNEPESTPQHTKRMRLADLVIRDALKTPRKLILTRVLLNPTIDGASSDNDIQFQVNGMINALIAYENLNGG